MNALLHHEKVGFSEWFIQLIIITSGLFVAFLASVKDMRKLYSNHENKPFARGVGTFLGSFILGFMLVAILLPIR